MAFPEGYRYTGPRKSGKSKPPTPHPISKAELEEYVSGAPTQYQPLYRKVLEGKAGRAECIKCKCLECGDWTVREVVHCCVFRCPLWSIRPFRDKAEQLSRIDSTAETPEGFAGETAGTPSA